VASAYIAFDCSTIIALKFILIMLNDLIEESLMKATVIELTKSDLRSNVLFLPVVAIVHETVFIGHGV
jgi:hypothetical protein